MQSQIHALCILVGFLVVAWGVLSISIRSRDARIDHALARLESLERWVSLSKSTAMLMAPILERLKGLDPAAFESRLAALESTTVPPDAAIEDRLRDLEAEAQFMQNERLSIKHQLDLVGGILDRMKSFDAASVDSRLASLEVKLAASLVRVAAAIRTSAYDGYLAASNAADRFDPSSKDSKGGGVDPLATFEPADGLRPEPLRFDGVSRKLPAVPVDPADEFG